MRLNAGTSCKAQDTSMVTIPEIETISREDLAWFAGFIDGEGNINVGLYGNGQNRIGKYWKTFRAELVVVNTNAWPIQKSTEILHKMKVFFKVSIRKRYNEKHSPSFELKVNGQRSSYKVLSVILPFLTCKKEIAKQAIYALEYRFSLGYKAYNNQYAQDDERVQDNEILHQMIDRARLLVKDKPSPFAFSLIASEPIKIKKPSETIRLTALRADDIVRPSVRTEETDRNAQSLAIN